MYEPLTDTIEDNSENLTKTTMLASKEINKALENLNNEVIEIMNDRSISASYFLSPLSKITNLETTSQFKSVK